ncbi:hypothetical protein OJ996_24610 [Luteolibacter sp. GHJ8]|uniref:Uncharacterized protein n=1 Tax=Luteolibacter rhizosphaerae TaxID=2989719 RepID=A0ABT3GAC5_9BACT|nr:hypothetical protein [Luteolibacter rhizosphaerae]MCW1916793.1 hypothetical protein [Luteolibacter rhizosphaerae]
MIETPEWLQQALVSATTTGAAIWIIQKYALAKIKHDFDLKLENLKPLTAEETLRRENYLNSKRDAFFEVTATLGRYMESSEWDGPDVPPSRTSQCTKPSEAEINGCMAKLALYSDSPEILTEFTQCFQTISSVSFGRLLSLMRQDLGYGALPIDPESYKYVFIHNGSVPAPADTAHATARPDVAPAPHSP